MESNSWSVSYCLTVLSYVFLTLNIICICTYCFPILLVYRLRTSNNLITVNVCFASVLCTIYWTLYFSLDVFLSNSLKYQSCNLMIYIQTTINCQAAFSLCVLSIYRFCTFVYRNKRWFNKRQSMIVCLIYQWLIAIILPIPIWCLNIQSCSLNQFPVWIWIYNLSLIVFLPTIFVTIIDGLIFIHAHHSTRRVQPNIITHSRRIKTRNTHLLQRMFFMLIVTVSGWTPIYIIACLESSSISVSPMIYRILRFLPIFSISIITGNLFLYNHALRRYLKHKFLR